MLVTHLVVPTPCDFVTSFFTSVDYKTVTFSVFCLSLVFLLMRKTRKYLRKGNVKAWFEVYRFRSMSTIFVSHQLVHHEFK